MTKERAKKALKATRSIGLPDKEVIPVLKELLKVFDKNWEPIEAENYRALVDAYFETKHNKAIKVGEKGAVQIIAVKEEGQEGGRPKSQLCSESTRDNHPPLAKQSIVEAKKKIGQNVNRIANFADHPGSSSNHSNFIIASSTKKDVKILLDCAAANFQKLDFNSVVKSLEDNLRVNKLVTPQFSVKELLKDLCESYVKLSPASPNRLVAENSPAARKVPVLCPNPRPNKRLCGASSSESSDPHNINKILLQEKNFVVRVCDISKGAENVKISLVDKVGRGYLPMFTYMSRSVIYQNANLQISLARISDEDCCTSCSGDCLASEIPCACARETGGEFAYTKLGLLKEEYLKNCMSVRQNPLNDHMVFCQDCPLERSKNELVPNKCKGHLLRKFIKECWTKCGCDMNCGNRVVQRGIRHNLQVYMTGEGKGWGVRPLEKLAKGTFICEYVGEILTNMELYDRNMQSSGSERHTYPVTLDADWASERLLKDEEALCLDATFSGNVARFINHRCHDANLIDIPVEVETPDRHYYHLAFFTTREVGALEELTWDYGIDFGDDDHPIKAFTCCCGSTFCRDVKGKRHV